jgi:hypothetical protein
VENFLKEVAGPFLGFLAALVAFRVRFLSVEKDMAAHIAQNASDRQHDKELLALALDGIRCAIKSDSVTTAQVFDRMERLQSVSLEILAALARKNDVAHRAIGADALVNLLGGQNDGNKN